LPACAAVASHNGNFFDLTGLSKVKDVDESDFHVKGHDYSGNFTMNICAPVLSAPSAISGVTDLTNVSAYYTTDSGETFSIGEMSTQPYFRGRRLMLEYTNGSPCPDTVGLRKSTIITLACDRELLTHISLAFVGQVHDCAYFFEARTPHACAKAGSTGGGADTLGPFGIFALIVFVMISVYVLVVSRRRVPYVHAFFNKGFGWISPVMGV
ncbi:mannose-6-phosphate receptor binding domain-containing protein, partial [Limtongia smithiae]|uniref:mannose-6-phosphate receptor binding domain-containing protein n=1 Tax=Limtongia smithiae TaxID=1125753 RepID=UPI0034CD6A3B